MRADVATSAVTCSSPPQQGPGQGPEHAIAGLTELGFEFGPPQPTTRSVLDTFDGRLHRAGARLDARPVYKPGSTDAVELSPHGVALPDRSLVVSQLPQSPSDLPAGQFRLQLESIVRDRALLVQLTMTSQCAHAIRRNRDGKAVARLELHTDIEVADADGRPCALGDHAWCLELHELPGHRKHARRARRHLDDLGLETFETDSVGWSAIAAGLTLSGIDISREADLRRKDSAAVAFRQVLHVLADAVEMTWQGTADELDPEFLHDLRVALRRSRTVLRAAVDVMPDEARRAAIDLAESITLPTAAPRDLDVHLAGWDTLVDDDRHRLALEPVRHRLEARRRAAHDHLRAVLTEVDRDVWRSGWNALVDSDRDTDGERPRRAQRRVGAVVADRVERAHARLVRDGRRITPTSPSTQVHRLRKDAKRLRYLLECFGSLVDGPHGRRYLARLKALQEHLGESQDLAVFRAELISSSTSLTADDASTDTLAALEALIDRIDERARELRSEFDGVFGSFDDDRTRRALKRVLRDLGR